ncbi:hypothetical protein CVT26_011667 [Gymnopilus dilepis]|uniref:Uncharacterized protein n=1 Tax=Gymnopilus dilepis TaxID=231916 RepID=A0A409W8X9_9AGAR|nr:hypothetical protein CVT26_011667 [Gymnopilus dilepis]
MSTQEIQEIQCNDPVQSLPPEVASQVFVFAAVEGLQSALQLAEVCPMWRDLAWSTPHLWTTWSVSLGLVRNQTRIERLTTLLDRSGVLPLDIVVEYLSPSQSADTGCLLQVSPETDKEIITKLNNNSDRWRHLKLRLPAPLFSQFHGNQGKLVLEELTLRAPETSANQKTSPIFRMNADEYPEPIKIDILKFRLNDLKVGWSRLTVARVHSIQLDECLQLLRVAPQIEELTLKNLEGIKEEYFPLPLEPIQHDKLRKLTLVSDDQSAEFFDNIALPYLEDLDIWQVLLADPSFHDFIRRSSSPLRLRLSGVTIEDDKDLIEPAFKGLERCTALVHLEMDIIEKSEAFTVAFLERLAATSLAAHGESPFLSHLSALRFMRDRPFPWPLLLPVFGPLDQLTNPCRRPLNEVEFCVGNSGYDFQCWGTDNVSANPRIIDRDSIRGLFSVFDAGLKIQITEMDRDGNREDLLQKSFDFHFGTAH